MGPRSGPLNQFIVLNIWKELMDNLYVGNHVIKLWLKVDNARDNLDPNM